MFTLARVKILLFLQDLAAGNVVVLAVEFDIASFLR